MSNRLHEILHKLHTKIRHGWVPVKVLAVVVVFITTYSLIMPALTLESSVAERMSGIELDHESEGETETQTVVATELQATAAEETQAKAESVEESLGETATESTTVQSSIETETDPSVEIETTSSGEKETLSSEEVSHAEDTVTFKSSTESVSVTALAEDGTFPEGTQMIIKDIEDENTLDVISDAVDGKIEKIHAVDITFLYNEKEIEPEKPVKVIITPVEAMDENLNAEIVHLDNDGEAKVIEAADDKVIDAVAEAVEEELADDAVVFEAESFSVYAVVYTVDFYFDDYEYHLEGGSEILLSQLFALLDIDVDITEVENVAFTNEGVLAVEELDGDWKLVSLEAFDTDELLTVKLKDGGVIEIRVRDEADNNTEITVQYVGSGTFTASGTSIPNGTKLKASGKVNNTPVMKGLTKYTLSGTNGKNGGYDGNLLVTQNTWGKSAGSGYTFAGFIVDQLTYNCNGDNVSGTYEAGKLQTDVKKFGFDVSTTITGIFKETGTKFIYYATDGNGYVSSSSYFETGNDRVYYSFSNTTGATAVPNQGYVFDHWEYEGKMYDGLVFDSTLVSSDTVVTAVFKEVETHTLTFKSTLGTTYVYPANAGRVANASYQEKVIEGEFSVGAVTYTTATNRFFTGWFDEDGHYLTGSTELSISTPITEDKTYLAVYTNGNDRLLGYSETPDWVSWRIHNSNHSGSSKLWSSKLTLDAVLQFTIAEGYELDSITLNGVPVPSSGYNRNGSTYSLRSYLDENYSSGLNYLVVNARPLGSHKILYEAETGGTVTNTEDFISSTITPGGSTAIPSDGYKFTGWYLDGEEIPVLTNSTITADDIASLSLTTDTTLTAKFEIDSSMRFTVSVAPGEAYGDVTYHTRGEDLTYLGAHMTNDAGQTKNTITATPKENAEFDHWELNGKVLEGVGATIPSGFQLTAPNSELVAVFKKTGSYTIRYEAGTGGSVNNTEDHPINTEDTVLGSTATANDGYQFAGWFEKLADGQYIGVKNADAEKYNTESSLVPSGDQIKDDVTYVAMFRPVAGSGNGIVGYNMNLTGVEASWTGEKDFVYITSYGSVVYCDDNNGEYFKNGDTVNIANITPTATGYKFVTWFDKTRTAGSGDATPAAMRSPGDTAIFRIGNEVSYTFDAIWIQGKADDVIVPYDEQGHMVVATSELILGSMTSDSRWADELDAFKDSFSIKKNAAGQDDITYTVVSKDGVPVENGPSGPDITVTEPGVYEVQAEFIVVYQKSATEKIEYVFDDVTAKVTILPKTVTVIKVWDDNDDQYSIRPEELSIPLTGSNGTSITPVSWEKEEDNTWAAVYTGLPFKDANGMITYTATESDVPSGYEMVSNVKTTEQAYAGTFGDSSLTNDTITITNKMMATPIRVKKVDSASGEVLTGAVFQLTRETKGAYAIYTADDEQGYYTVGESGSLKGIFRVVLPDGKYKLTETTSPTGYSRLAQPIEFEISRGTLISGSNDGEFVNVDATEKLITVKNLSGVVLPSTGGHGTKLYYLLGAAFILLSGVLLMKRKSA